jgi:hypothetical protein
MRVAWYFDRLSRMGSREITGRLRDMGVKAIWRRQKGCRARVSNLYPSAQLPILPRVLATDHEATTALVTYAERIVAGKFDIFGREFDVPRRSEDWFLDPDTGTAAPATLYAFDIDARDPAAVGNHKFLLEPSRLQHVTILGTAYWLTRREAFAEAAAAQLRSWWIANPFLTGVHWTSGIEIGLRLTSIAWTGRLLTGWQGHAALFEESELARDQIYRHQYYLANLPSHGSSSNNHLIAELLGLYVGATAFPWFTESAAWSERGAQGLAAEAVRQVFPDGVSREQASEYHGFVLEMFLVAAVEALVADRPFSPSFHTTIARMADAWAAFLDVRLRPARQGDSDDAHVLLLDPPDRRRRGAALLAAAAAVIGPCSWWPQVESDICSTLFDALCRGRAKTMEGRPSRRPNLFPDAGMAILRDLEVRPDELWCRCDHGPHGFLAIAAHAHADALSIELRHGGIDLLADPGTYCYLTDPTSRHYFRSTVAHNTLEFLGDDQARYAGPFLWLDAPDTYLVEIDGLDGGTTARWVARTDSSSRHRGHPVHERSISFDRAERLFQIDDRVIGPGGFPVRLAFHLGPAIESASVANVVHLQWENDRQVRRARLLLPTSLAWQYFRGSTDPALGWYSPSFGRRQPSGTWIGAGIIDAATNVRTILEIEAA